jgi:hypothetical protein
MEDATVMTVSNRIAVLGLVGLMLAGTAACGRMADLEAPPERRTERGMRDAGAPSLEEPATINRSSTQQPIDGGPANPYSGSGSPRS